MLISKSSFNLEPKIYLIYLFIYFFHSRIIECLLHTHSFVRGHGREGTKYNKSVLMWTCFTADTGPRMWKLREKLAKQSICFGQ